MRSQGASDPCSPTHRMTCLTTETNDRMIYSGTCTPLLHTNHSGAPQLSHTCLISPVDYPDTASQRKIALRLFLLATATACTWAALRCTVSHSCFRSNHPRVFQKTRITKKERSPWRHLTPKSSAAFMRGIESLKLHLPLDGLFKKNVMVRRKLLFEI